MTASGDCSAGWRTGPPTGQPSRPLLSVAMPLYRTPFPEKFAPVAVRFEPCRGLDLDPADVLSRDVLLRGFLRDDALKTLFGSGRQQLLIGGLIDQQECGPDASPSGLLVR